MNFTEGQLVSSDSDPTSLHCGRAKCIIGHMRPALFLVHFCSKFMVLVLKRLKIRVIASNLQKRGRKSPFWTYAVDKISKCDCLELLWCVFWYFLSNILAHHWKEFKTASWNQIWGAEIIILKKGQFWGFFSSCFGKMPVLYCLFLHCWSKLG